MTTHRVLVIDDDASLRRLLRLSLVSVGFDVVTAQDGAQGLERLSLSEFDAIVLDLQMPVIDGRAFYREMRAAGCETRC